MGLCVLCCVLCVVCCVSCVVCRVSCVLCRVSCVVCRVSCVVCRVVCRVPCAVSHLFTQSWALVGCCSPVGTISTIRVVPAREATLRAAVTGPHDCAMPRRASSLLQLFLF